MPEQVVRLAVERGCRAVALADPNLHGAIEFFIAARDAGIKPVIGGGNHGGQRALLPYVRDRTGNAADTLVCYCIGISDVWPIRFELYFRRFLNRERMVLNKLPDIDIDFAVERKDDVGDLICKYGGHAAIVGGFNAFRGRSAFADIAKLMGSVNTRRSASWRDASHVERPSRARNEQS